ncbi:MAG: glycosyltransferase family 4 protein [Eubacteriales bacterium]|nr:glycosyltransferase family 4 protein [Eubacteriales bacterium]
MKNKKIAIVSNGYAWFPCEPGPNRFFYIANLFVNAGYDVEVITVDFQHFQKKARDTKKILSENYPFKITFVKTPPYNKNIDFKRIRSNQTVAKNIASYLTKSQTKYDAVYCSIPSNRVAARVSEYCRQNGIPFIVDIEDLWPEAMSMVLPKNPLTSLFLRPLKKDAETAYKNASGAIGTSEDYTARAVKNNYRSIPMKTVYVGCDLDVFDEGVRTYSGEIEKPENEYWVTYAGSLGKSYDILTLIDAAGRLEKEGHADIKIKILGTGPRADEFKNHAKEIGCGNVEFLGYTAYPKMAAYLHKSDAAINSFVKGAPQSIVNKVGDYLSSGRPMINTLENPVFCDLVTKKDFGINVPAEDAKALAEGILLLKNNPELSKKYSVNARITAEREFDRKTAYQAIVDMADLLIQDNSERK